MNGRVPQLAWLLISSAVVFPACRKESATPGASVETHDAHGDAVRELITAPRRFQEVVSTIRDEASYDRAAPGLEEVVQKFRDSTAAFRKLNPPAEPEQAKYRQMIEDGFRDTGLTGEDMLSLVSVDSREKEVFAWLESFRAAGQEAGIEMQRLYGRIPVPGAHSEEAELEQFRAQLEAQARGQVQELLKRMEKEAAKVPPEPVAIGDNPLLEHLGNEPAEDDR
jgi:hypothetical protein